jgi:hypothetical protein
MAAKRKKIKQNRHRINKDELMQEYFEDMKCMGCVSPAAAYRFAHYMNQCLDRNFRLFVPSAENTSTQLIVNNIEYQYFQCNDETRDIDYTIVCNRNKTDYLLPELPKSDFIILMKGIKSYMGQFEEVYKQVQEAPTVSYVFEFDPLKLKSMDYLVL